MARETILIGSVTYAMKAKRALADAGIRARLIKSSENRSHGCTYGLEYDETVSLAAAAALRKNGIHYERDRNGGA